ncbi:hypothetical protein [Bartonella sp. HY406]|nr:hypothetical protein [Bartonella sp. HY406]UXN04997.1 hypothetical protein N6B01_14065 [Bartonella sp. HY406]
MMAFVVWNKDYDDYDDYDVMIDEAPETEPFFVRDYFDDYHEMLDFKKNI